jgi:antibiotic biosynthesis monooxygenase (ABM) superfamily enzyme
MLSCVNDTPSQPRRREVIARIWRGWTTPENAGTYERIVSGEVLPSIAERDLPGYHGAYLLRREADGEVEFATIMLFETIENVRSFAGTDYERAYVPDRARAVLVHFDERSAHYETLLKPTE